MKWISSLSAAAVAVLFWIPVSAQMMPGKMGPAMMGREGMMGGFCGEHVLKGSHFYFFMSKEIGLSDEQLDKLKKIKMESKKKAIRLKAELEVTEIELEELLKDDPIDMKEVEKKVSQIVSVKKEKMLLKAGKKADMSAVLSKKQRETAEKLRWEKKRECMMWGTHGMGGYREGPHHD